MVKIMILVFYDFIFWVIMIFIRKVLEVFWEGSWLVFFIRSFWFISLVFGYWVFIVGDRDLLVFIVGDGCLVMKEVVFIVGDCLVFMVEGGLVVFFWVSGFWVGVYFLVGNLWSLEVEVLYI